MSMVLNSDVLNKEGIHLMGLTSNPNETVYTHALNTFKNDYKNGISYLWMPSLKEEKSKKG